MAEVELAFADVRAVWRAAGGKNTGGIIEWFAPVVTRWVQTAIGAADVADLLFIGAEGGGRWADATGGSNRLGDLAPAPPPSGFRWNPEWVLVAVRNPETGAQVLIDGNERARALQLAVQAGEMPPDTTLQLGTGELHMQMVLISKATSSFWR